MRFDLAGRVSLGVTDDDDRVLRYVGKQMAPFAGTGGTEAAATADVVLAAAIPDGRPILERHGPANDDLTTATDGERVFVLVGERRCAIPDALAGGQARFDHDPGFPLWRLFRTAIRPAMQVSAAVSGRAVAVHAATVTMGGGAIVVAGWSESGKTETALGLMESGAQFLSDKWTLLDPAAGASAFPISVGVRRWVLEYLPTLRASLTRGARAQFALARLAAVGLDPIAGRSAGARSGAFVADAARRVSELGDRAAFEIDELRAAYGQDDDPARVAPTRLFVALRTIPDGPVRVTDADRADVAARLARSAAFERRRYLELLQRAGYALPSRPASRHDEAIAADEAILAAALERVPVVSVDAPFPTDPRRVADAILAIR
jgi:hypothetical protein